MYDNSQMFKSNRASIQDLRDASMRLDPAPAPLTSESSVDYRSVTASSCRRRHKFYRSPIPDPKVCPFHHALTARYTN